MEDKPLSKTVIWVVRIVLFLVIAAFAAFVVLTQI